MIDAPRRRRETLFIVVFFVAASIAWTWPAVTVLRSAYVIQIADPNTLQRADMDLTTWMLAWAAHALRTNPLGLFHANIFYPLPWSFAFSEQLVASALLMMPVDILFGNPMLDHNLLSLLTFVLGGVGTALLLRELGCSLAPALLGGSLFVFNGFRFGTLGHVQVLSAHWMPFTLLALHRLLAGGRRAAAVAFGVCLTLVALSCVYYLYFFGAALGVFLVLHWVLRCPAAPGARRLAWTAIVGSAAFVGALMVPYVHARTVYSLARTWNQAVIFSMPALAYFGALLDPKWTPYLGQTVVGLGGVLLALAGLVGGVRADQGGRRTAIVYLGVTMTGVLLALGPNMRLYSLWAAGVPGPWRLLAAVVPGFDALRVPARAAAVALLGIAVLAGLGADLLLRLARRRVAHVLALLVVIAVGLDESWRPALYTVPVPWGTTPPPVYRWLAAQPGPFAMVELPLGIPSADARAMLLSTYHWKQLVNGYSGFLPTTRYFRRLCLGFPSDESIRVLASIGVRLVVIHVPDVIPAHSRLCTAPALPSTLARVYRDPTTCVLAITGAAPTPAPAPDRAVPLEGVTVATSSGDDARAAIDGDLATHWVQPVDREHPGWLELRLPSPHRISRIVVRLDSHFGEFLREYELQASNDNGKTWATLASNILPEPPLVDMQTRPDDLRTEILVAPEQVVAASRYRIVRPAAVDTTDLFDLWPTWPVWGVHELALYEAP
jgi:hypothetical protein